LAIGALAIRIGRFDDGLIDLIDRRPTGRDKRNPAIAGLLNRSI